MTRSHSRNYGPARQREHDIMDLLALVACGQEALRGDEDTETLRQLGYAAHLVNGRVPDPDGNLDRFVRWCLSRVRDLPKVDRAYREPVQARWGAAHSLNPRKLRTELPLHIRKLSSGPAPVSALQSQDPAQRASRGGTADHHRLEVPPEL